MWLQSAHCVFRTCLEERCRKSLISCPTDKKVSEARPLHSLDQIFSHTKKDDCFSGLSDVCLFCHKVCNSVKPWQCRPQPFNFVLEVTRARGSSLRFLSLFLLNYVFILQVAEDIFHLWHTFLMFSQCWSGLFLSAFLGCHLAPLMVVLLFHLMYAWIYVKVRGIFFLTGGNLICN